MDNSETIVKS